MKIQFQAVKNRKYSVAKKEPDRPILSYLILFFLSLVVLDKAGISGSSLRKLIPEKFNKYRSEVPVVDANFNFDIPEIKINPENISEPVPVLDENSETSFLEDASAHGIYFIKFYVSQNKTYTKLVKSQRLLKGDFYTKVRKILKELGEGPDREEQEKGLLSSLPKKFVHLKKLRLKDGVLHISLRPAIVKDAGRDLLQDRIDQITYTLMEFSEVKGVRFYLDDKPIKSLGDDKLQLPQVYTGNPRKIVFL